MNNVPALCVFLCSVLLSGSAIAEPESVEVAVEEGEDVDITSGAVTALSCALQARDEGRLDVLNACPLMEVSGGIVVYDVADRQIYQLDTASVRMFELEQAFGGGSIDFSGTVDGVDDNGVAKLTVEKFTVTPRPKAGSFKGCL